MLKTAAVSAVLKWRRRSLVERAAAHFFLSCRMRLCQAPDSEWRLAQPSLHS